MVTPSTIAEANAANPVPAGISFGEATTIPVQGVSAYCLLKYGASLKPIDSVLVQSAAGGVGLYLGILRRAFGAAKVIALASSTAKLELLRNVARILLSTTVIRNGPPGSWMRRMEKVSMWSSRQRQAQWERKV